MFSALGTVRISFSLLYTDAHVSGNRRHFSYTACVAFVALGFLTQLNLGVGQPDIVNANLSEVFVGEAPNRIA